MAELKLQASFINALRIEVIQAYQKVLITDKPLTPKVNVRYPVTDNPPVQNERDFEYGIAVGMLRYAALVYFTQNHKRQPTKQERAEMYAIIERSIDELRDYYYKADLK